MNHMADIIAESDNGYGELPSPHSRHQWMVELSNSSGGGYAFGAHSEEEAQSILKEESAKPGREDLEPHIFRVEQWQRWYPVEVQP